MYATIVSRTIRSSWASMNHGDYNAVLRQLAPEFRYEFFGNHALSGVRRTRAALERFFERLFRLFPGARFTVRDVLVKGAPWDTTAVALVEIEVGLPTSQVYRNQISQTIRLRWGRITEIRTLEDTQRLVEVLRALREGGLEEAGAPPIQD
jgi:ketosteroid isomerase-like protein